MKKNKLKKKKSLVKKLLLSVVLLLMIAVGICLIINRKSIGDQLIIRQLSKSDVDSKPDSIPDYSDEDYIVLNNNKPNFTTKDIELIEGEYFSNLDYLGRCGTVVARLHKSLMPTEERGEIGQIKPSGWKQNKYPRIVKSEPPYLYNRSHLIAFAMTGQNDNPKNLITGTRYFNLDIMLSFEKKILNYLDRTDNHVIYRVTPLFRGNNLLATGVELEAFSVEDSGAGICMHVFLYNHQPGIEIDYKTGDNKAK